MNKEYLLNALKDDFYPNWVYNTFIKIQNSSVYGKFGNIETEYTENAKKKGRPMKKPYDLIFDTICRRTQYEKDIMELGNKNNHYKEWNKFLQRYIMCEKYLDKGEK